MSSGTDTADAEGDEPRARLAPVTWTSSVAESSHLAWLAALGFAPIAGMGAVGVMGVVVLLATAVRSGNVGALALATLFVLVGGPFSVLYLLPMLRDPDQRPSLGRPVLRAIGIRRLLVTVPFGVGLVWWSFRLDGSTGFLLVAAAIGCPLVLVSAVTSTGVYDPDDGLSYRGRSVPLAAVRRVRRIAVGPVVVLHVGYHPGATGLLTPRWLVVPAAIGPSVHTVLADAAAAGPPADATGRSWPATVVLVGFGLLFLGFGAGVLTLRPSDGRVVLTYVAVVCGTAGVLFLLAALRA